MVMPGAKREAVAYARDHHGLSERRACSLVGVSRRGWMTVFYGNACANWPLSAAGSAIAA